MTNEEIRTLLQDAKTPEEAATILQDNNIELSGEELEQVAGGAGAANAGGSKAIEVEIYNQYEAFPTID